MWIVRGSACTRSLCMDWLALIWLVRGLACTRGLRACSSPKTLRAPEAGCWCPPGCVHLAALPPEAALHGTWAAAKECQHGTRVDSGRETHGPDGFYLHAALTMVRACCWNAIKGLLHSPREQRPTCDGSPCRIIAAEGSSVSNPEQVRAAPQA